MDSLCTLTERQVLTDFIQVQMKEITRLKEENETLKNNVKKLNARKQSSKKNSPRSSSFDETAAGAGSRDNRKTNNMANYPKFSTEAPDSKSPLLTDRISSLSGELRNAEQIYRSTGGSVEVDLGNARQYVCALENEVELVCEEFDKKFSETVQFKNLKRMLEGKNVQLKELRARLRLHEPDHEL